MPSAADLRRLARRSKDAAQARCLLALAAIYDGGTSSEAARHKRISWVTTTCVIPAAARVRMASWTSCTSSGSSAEVGSSNSISRGFMATARTMATRCCWPPESWLGRSLRCPASPLSDPKGVAHLQAQLRLAMNALAGAGESGIASQAGRVGLRSALELRSTNGDGGMKHAWTPCAATTAASKAPETRTTKRWHDHGRSAQDHTQTHPRTGLIIGLEPGLGREDKGVIASERHHQPPLGKRRLVRVCPDVRASISGTEGN